MTAPGRREVHRQRVEAAPAARRRRRPWRRRNWPTACTGSRADMSHSPSSSRTTSSSSKVGRARHAVSAILAETKRLIPNKRIKYVVNTHPHFDHAGGLGPFAAEGITILTDDNNKYFLQQALGSPRTLVGDTLAKSGKKPKVEGVIEKMVIRDDTRTIELHHITNLEHSDGMLVAYLPKERILFTADFNVPAAGQPVSPSITTLVENIERLQLDFDRHVLVHAPNPDRRMTKADLLALAKGGQ